MELHNRCYVRLFGAWIRCCSPRNTGVAGFSDVSGPGGDQVCQSHAYGFLYLQVYLFTVFCVIMGAMPPPRVYSFQNQKGGSGKSTASINFAGELALRGQRVLFIDTDPQGTALDWSAARTAAGLSPLFSVVGYPRVGLHKEIQNLGQGYDTVIIDNPARATDIPRSNILASDAVVIPVQPSPADIWATNEVLNLLEEASVFKENIISAFLVSRRIVGTSLGKSVRESLEGRGPTLLNTTIGQRIVYAESFITGQVVKELEPNSVAAEEISGLADEIGKLGVLVHG